VLIEHYKDEGLTAQLFSDLGQQFADLVQNLFSGELLKFSPS
jgi:hypothetical protein